MRANHFPFAFMAAALIAQASCRTALDSESDELAKKKIPRPPPPAMVRCAQNDCGDRYLPTSHWAEPGSKDDFVADKFVPHDRIVATTLHHLVTKQADDAGIADVMRAVHERHKKDYGPGIAYHFVIFRSGKIVQARPLTARGASSRGYSDLRHVDDYYGSTVPIDPNPKRLMEGHLSENTAGHALIAFDGNFEPASKEYKKNGTTVSAEARTSLWWLASCIAQKYQVSKMRVRGHRHNFAKTECPGDLLIEEIAQLRTAIGENHASGCNVLALPDLKPTAR